MLRNSALDAAFLSSLSVSCIAVVLWGLKRWPERFSKRPKFDSPAPIWWLKAIGKSSSKGSGPLFWPLPEPSTLMVQT